MIARSAAHLINSHTPLQCSSRPAHTDVSIPLCNRCSCLPTSLLASQSFLTLVQGMQGKSNGWCVNANKLMSLTLPPCPCNPPPETSFACIMAPAFLFALSLFTLLKGEKHCKSEISEGWEYVLRKAGLHSEQGTGKKKRRRKQTGSVRCVCC